MVYCEVTKSKAEQSKSTKRWSHLSEMIKVMNVYMILSNSGH